MLFYLCFIIWIRIKNLKFINMYLMVLLIDRVWRKDLYLSRYRKYSIKLIFAVTLQGRFYVKIPGMETSEFFFFNF